MAKKSRYLAYLEGVKGIEERKDMKSPEKPSSVRKRLLLMKEEAKKQNKKTARKED